MYLLHRIAFISECEVCLFNVTTTGGYGCFTPRFPWGWRIQSGLRCIQGGHGRLIFLNGDFKGGINTCFAFILHLHTQLCFFFFFICVISYIFISFIFMNFLFYFSVVRFGHPYCTAWSVNQGHLLSCLWESQQELQLKSAPIDSVISCPTCFLETKSQKRQLVRTVFCFFT